MNRTDLATQPRRAMTRDQALNFLTGSIKDKAARYGLHSTDVGAAVWNAADYFIFVDELAETTGLHASDLATARDAYTVERKACGLD